jgi:hypothetical protein
MNMGESGAFAKLIEAVRPWLGHLVIVGGWAHRLHRLHPLAVAPQYAPIRTRDADVALSVHARLVGNVRQALENAGFVGHFSGEHTPPVTQYRLGDEYGGFYAEFLAPLYGDGLTRDGKPDVTISKSGITAQKLRHLDVLLTLPWSVRIGPAVGFPTSIELEVLIANPISFIVQKLLIRSQRPGPKRAQDILYIYDTLELFSASLEPLHRLWADELRSKLHAKAAKRVQALAHEIFAVVTDDVRDAALIPQDRRLAAEDVRAACAFGLEEILA